MRTDILVSDCVFEDLCIAGTEIGLDHIYDAESTGSRPDYCCIWVGDVP